jgi:tetratricopeptide (TPR) repeat protein
LLTSVENCPSMVPMRLFIRPLLLVLAAAFALAALPGQAEAQSEDEDREQARAEFVAGSEAATGGRWADSLEHFQRAYLMSGVPTALFNAAMALRALGRHREARDAFRRVVDVHGDSPAAEPSREKAVEEAARVAVLTLAGLDAEADYEIRINGRTHESSRGVELEIEADPGPNGVQASRDGYESWTWEGRLEDGARQTLQVEMVEIEVETTSVFKSPVFWVIAGVVLVGAGVGVGLFLQQNAQLDVMHPDNALEI